MTDHDHVEEFCLRVDAKGKCRVGRRGKHARHRCHFEQVGGVSAAGTFCVVGVDGATIYSCDRIFDIATLIECIGVDGHLDIILVGYRKRCTNGGRSRTPVFVYFESADTCFDLFDDGGCGTTVAFAEQANIHRKTLRGL